MTDHEAKTLAIARLAHMGVTIPTKPTLDVLIEAIELATGSSRPYYTRRGDFVHAFAQPVTPARQAPPFRPYSSESHRHPRLADIDRGQPPMMTPNGIGNGKQPGGFLPEVWGRA